MNRIVVVAALVASGCPATPEPPATSGDYLYVWAWASDTTRGSLLAAFDLGQNPPKLTSVLPADAPSRGAHHIEHDLGPDSLIFSNAFGAGRALVFDLGHAGQPHLQLGLADAGPLTPH